MNDKRRGPIGRQRDGDRTGWGVGIDGHAVDGESLCGEPVEDFAPSRSLPTDETIAAPIPVSGRARRSWPAHRPIASRQGAGPTTPRQYQQLDTRFRSFDSHLLSDLLQHHTFRLRHGPQRPQQIEGPSRRRGRSISRIRPECNKVNPSFNHTTAHAWIGAGTRIPDRIGHKFQVTGRMPVTPGSAHRMAGSSNVCAPCAPWHPSCGMGRMMAEQGMCCRPMRQNVSSRLQGARKSCVTP